MVSQFVQKDRFFWSVIHLLDRSISSGVDLKRAVVMVLVVDRACSEKVIQVFVSNDAFSVCRQTDLHPGCEVIIKVTTAEGCSQVSGMAAVSLGRLLDQNFLPVVVLENGDQRVLGW